MPNISPSSTMEGPCADEKAPLLIEQEQQQDVEYGTSTAHHKVPIVGDIPEIPSKHAIGMLGSLAIAVNSLTGPAMVNLPATFQRSGLIPTTAAVLFTCVLSSLCSLHMADIISKVPGNLNFVHEVEFCEAFKIFWSDRLFVVTQIIFFLCVSCLNVSSIVDTAQVVDTFVGHWSQSGALLFHKGAVRFVSWSQNACTDEEKYSGECIPFSHHSEGFLLTLGYLVIILIFLPMALMDLKENAAWQVLGFSVLLFNSIQFAIEFAIHGFHTSNLSLWGESWGGLLGVCLFNFALVIAIPAWLYEKDPGVDVGLVVYSSSGLSAFLYILVGALGAMSISNISENMLESMMSGVFGTTMQLGASSFAFMIIGLGIPLFSVITRMSLEGSGLTTHKTGNILAVFLPFSISWMLYQGASVTTLLAWGGVLFTSAVAFLLPLVLALHILKEYEREGVISVYRGFAVVQTREQKIVATKVLLALASLSVAAAILGLLFFGGPS